MVEIFISLIKEAVMVIACGLIFSAVLTPILRWALRPVIGAVTNFGQFILRFFMRFRLPEGWRQNLLRFVYDPRPWNQVSPERWTAIGGAGGNGAWGGTLEHWLITRELAAQYPRLLGFANSWLNSSLLIPKWLNSWLGHRFGWRRSAEALTILGSFIGIPYGAYQVGEEIGDRLVEYVMDTE